MFCPAATWNLGSGVSGSDKGPKKIMKNSTFYFSRFEKSAKICLYLNCAIIIYETKMNCRYE